MYQHANNMLDSLTFTVAICPTHLRVVHQFQVGGRGNVRVRGRSESTYAHNTNEESILINPQHIHTCMHKGYIVLNLGMEDWDSEMTFIHFGQECYYS